MATQTGYIDLTASSAVKQYAQAGFESAAATYSTKSELETRADGILATVERQYANALTATGEIATLDGVATAPLASLVAYGRSVQDGSPTPSAPVEIASVDSLSIEVSGRNIAYQLEDWYRSSDMTYSDGVMTKAATTSTSWERTSDYAYPAEMFYGRTWTVSFDLRSDDFSDTDGLRSIQINMGASASLRGGRTKYRALVNASLFPVPTSTWTRHSFTFTPTDESWFTSGSGAVKYAGIAFWSNTKNSWQLRNVQLELGSTATEYEQHQGTSTPVDLQGHQLRSLPDGTRDELSVDSAGNVTLTQRVGSVTFDGSSDETWTANTSRGNNIFYTPVPDRLGATLVQSNRFEQIASIGSITGTEGKIYTNHTVANQVFNFSLPSSVTSVALLRTWLAANPTEVIYPLASPVSVDLGTIAMPQVSDGSTVWLSASMAVEATYTAWMPNSEALRSSISQTADGVLATISQSYATKDEVATLVRAYGDGVLVCKRGQTIGALINADGSFDVVSLTWSGDVPTADVGDPLMRSDADGTELRAGGESVAQFGQTARIGREGEAHVEVSDTGMSATDMGGNTAFVVSSSGVEREIEYSRDVGPARMVAVPYSSSTTATTLGRYKVPTGETLSPSGWNVVVRMSSANYMAYVSGSASGTGCTARLETGGTQGSYPDALFVQLTPSAPSAGATIANATATATLASSQSGATRGTLTLTLKATCAATTTGELAVTVTMTTVVTGMNYDPYTPMATALCGKLGFSWTSRSYMPYLSFGTLSDSPWGYSSAFGEGLAMGRTDQLVVGQYNEKSLIGLLVVGDGTSDGARRNAFVVDSTGNATVRRKLVAQSGEFSDSVSAASVAATGTVSGASLSSTGAVSAASASVTGAVDAGSLTLGTALPVSEGGTGSTSVYKSTTVSQVISAASGRTVSSVSYASWGKVAMLSVTVSGFAASTGTQTVGTVVSGKRPVYAVYATAVTSAYAPYAQLATNGALTVYWSTAPSASTGYTVRFVYLLA